MISELINEGLMAHAMKSRRRVLIVGNYNRDQLQSMDRYARLLDRVYQQYAEVILLKPNALFGALPGFPGIMLKYLAYIDKLLFFFIHLALRARSFDRVHIADQGNAFYAFCCARRQSIVTCHDLLAVRAAFGDDSTACSTSPIGIWLQHMIIAGLRRAGTVVFVSEATRLDYQRLIGHPADQRQLVIPNPLNAPFCPDPQAFPLTPAEKALLPAGPYLLMVGSSHPRKNRGLALQLLERLGSGSPYSVVFAGAPLTQAEQAFRHNHPLGERLIAIERPSHALLNRLYCQAHALLFPSFAEGFGWPLLEAQSCHCPVIASSTTSIPEVAAAGALYADPTEVDAFVAHVRALEQPAERARLVALGSANTRRFNLDVVAEAYRSFAFQ